MKKNLLLFNLFLISIFYSRNLTAQLPAPVYGLRQAAAWDFSGANGVFYNTTDTIGYPEGVPDNYSWKYAMTGVTNLAASIQGRGPQGAIACYDQVYKHVPGNDPHPNCRVEIGPMRAMAHLISTGQWVDILNEGIQGGAFVEDFYNNEATGPDILSEANNVVSVRSGIGDASPTTAGQAGGVDSRGVGFNFHGFPSRTAINLADVDALFAYQQMRCVGPDASFTPYIANVGIDSWKSTTSAYDGFQTHGGISGGRFLPVTTDWQWFTNFVGDVSLIPTIPDSTAATVNVTGVSLSPSTVTVGTGTSTQLTAIIAPSNATNQNVTWTTSNSSIVSVNGTGQVSGVAAGTATITVTTQDGSQTATSAVTVTQSATNIINVGNSGDGITKVGGWDNTRSGDIDGDERMMPDASSYVQYSFTGVGVDIIGFEPGGSQYAANYTIYIDNTPVSTGNTSSSSDQFQVLLGSVTGLSNTSHTVKIAFSSAIGSSPYVIVDALKIYNSTSNVPVTSVSLSPTAVSLNVGATTTLSASIVPSNATNTNVTWSSSNTTVATVNTAGLVTGIAAGTATITVVTQDGAETAGSAVTVTSAANSNLALNKPYAAGSTSYNNIANAFDGSYSTGVSSSPNYGGNGSLAADLSATANINSIKVTFADVANYQVQGSTDGSTWINIGAKVNSPSNPNTTTYSGISYRYIRLVFDPFYAPGSGYWNPGIDEIEVYGNFTGGQSAQSSAKLATPGTQALASEPLQLRVYPNPTVSGNLSIHIDGQKESVKVKVFTQLGQPVYAGELSRGATIQLTGTVLKPGIYLIYVEGKDITAVKQVIVL